MKPTSSLLFTAAIVAVNAAAHAAPPTYRVTPVKDQAFSMGCQAINAQGDVAGTAVTEPRANFGYDAVVVSRGHAHSYGWSHGQKAAEANGINAKRLTVGDVITDQVFRVATPVAWHPDGRIERLPGLGGSGGEARAVNDAGDIVGTVDAPSDSEHAVMWIDGRIVDLAPGTKWSGAAAVNALRQAVGWSDGLPALFAGGQVTTLGTLGGSSGSAHGINASGLIVGAATLAGDALQHAFLYADGTMTDLGSLPGRSSVAYGINASGVVVGLATGSAGAPPTALVWFDGLPYRLDDLLDPVSGQGWTFQIANAVNDAGQICADGSRGGAVLTPVR